MPIQPRNSTGLLNIGRNYAHLLSRWAAGRASRYGFALGLLVLGVLMFVVSLGVATAAGFHFLELRYDAWRAYAVIGSAYLAFALILLLSGLVLLRQDGPPMPRPPSAGTLIRQAIPTSAAPRLFLASPGNVQGRGRARMLAAGAAALLAAWIVVTSRSD